MSNRRTLASVAVAAAIAAMPTTAYASPVTHVHEPAACHIARLVPPYSYDYQGARIDVPSGRVEVREARADASEESDPTAYLRTACRAIVSDYLTYGAPTMGGAVRRFIRVTEESPLWDCRVMGNHQCGPDSHWRVVGYW